MRPLIVKLAKMLTDCMDARLGLVRMDETRWEYKMLDTLLTDEMAELMLKMGRRRPTTAAELSEKNGWGEARVQQLLDEAHITANKNAIPFDKLESFFTENLKEGENA